MKVKCTKFLDNDDREQNTDPWLTINSVYIVLEILCDIEKREFYYRLITEIENEAPCLFNTEQFAIINHNKPSNWSVDINETGLIAIGPKSWQKIGFWEDYYDAEPAALKIYKREARIVYEEEGDHERFNI
jgi:hypothetical protein